MSGYEYLLQDPEFLSHLETLKSLRPVSIPYRYKKGDETRFFHLRRTRRDHFSFLQKAAENGVSFCRPVLNVRDPETHRFYLVTTHSPVTSLAEFLASPTPNKRKFAVLKKIATELSKLGKTGMRHGDVTSGNIFITKGDDVMLCNPELDEELVEHIQGDLEQFREMLFHLEAELDHEPVGLWQAVKTDPFFKNLK